MRTSRFTNLMKHLSYMRALLSLQNNASLSVYTTGFSALAFCPKPGTHPQSHPSELLHIHLYLSISVSKLPSFCLTFSKNVSCLINLSKPQYPSALCTENTLPYSRLCQDSFPSNVVLRAKQNCPQEVELKRCGNIYMSAV